MVPLGYLMSDVGETDRRSFRGKLQWDVVCKLSFTLLGILEPGSMRIISETLTCLLTLPPSFFQVSRWMRRSRLPRRWSISSTTSKNSILYSTSLRKMGLSSKKCKGITVSVGTAFGAFGLLKRKLILFFDPSEIVAHLVSRPFSVLV